MKKILLYGIAIGQVLAVSAQSNRNAVANKAVDKGYVVENATQPSNIKYPKIEPQTRHNKARNTDTQLGITTYDLQTNATVHDRIASNSSGTISVVWTASEENSSTFSDRGSGYTMFNADSNKWFQSPEYPRIESDRCGWPSILYDANGGEIIISHSTDANVLKLNSRSSIGTGNWSEKIISPNKYTWNRAAIGGANGNTIHMIAATDPDDSASYQDMTSALVYFRSQDGGQTFDKKGVLLPGMDSSTYGKYISNDAYAIAADGDHVAIALFNVWDDVTLWESMDNGSNWTRIIAYDFPFRGFKDFDKVLDTNFYIACDGAGSILIDDNGVVNLIFGRRQVSMGDTPNDNFYTYRRFTDSLFYYRNSSIPLLMTVGSYIDGNENNTIDIQSYSDYGYSGVLSMPNMAQGADGKLYCVYSGVNDTIISASDALTNMRNLYMITSTDGGDTWSDPLNISYHPGEWSISEDVYPDMDAKVGDDIRIVYHKDNLPSGYVRNINATDAPGTAETWQTNVSTNSVMFYRLDLKLNIGIEKVLSGNVEETTVYPNPSNGFVQLNVRVIKDVDVNINVTNMNGQVVHTYTGRKLKPGLNNVQMDLSQLGSGMYFINIIAEGSVLTEKVILN